MGDSPIIRSLAEPIYSPFSSYKSVGLPHRSQGRGFSIDNEVVADVLRLLDAIVHHDPPPLQVESAMDEIMDFASASPGFARWLEAGSLFATVQRRIAQLQEDLFTNLCQRHGVFCRGGFRERTSMAVLVLHMVDENTGEVLTTTFPTQKPIDSSAHRWITEIDTPCWLAFLPAGFADVGVFFGSMCQGGSAYRPATIIVSSNQKSDDASALVMGVNLIALYDGLAQQREERIGVTCPLFSATRPCCGLAALVYQWFLLGKAANADGTVPWEHESWTPPECASVLRQGYTVTRGPEIDSILREVRDVQVFDDY